MFLCCALLVNNTGLCLAKVEGLTSYPSVRTIERAYASQATRQLKESFQRRKQSLEAFCLVSLASVATLQQHPQESEGLTCRFMWALMRLVNGPAGCGIETTDLAACPQNPLCHHVSREATRSNIAARLMQDNHRTTKLSS